MEHHYRTGDDCRRENGGVCAREGYCPVCDGGLAVCQVCGLYEGSLTTDCPGVECYAEKAEAVYRGEIDYRNGTWVDGYTKHMTHVYGPAEA